MSDNRTKLILIAGQAEHGKDEFAKFLKEKYEKDGKKVFTVAYGDYLKFIYAKYFGWDGIKDEEGRSGLQYLGTEVVRERNPEFWVTIVKMLIDVFRYDFDVFLVPDTRFLNEINTFLIETYSVITIKVERPGHKNKLTEDQKNHISEKELRDYKFDYRIESRNLEELKEKTKKFYNLLKILEGEM